MSELRRTASIVFSVVMLAACGWHLQGATHLSPELGAMRIETEDTYSDFYRELHRALVAAGAQLTDDPHVARTVVRVKHDASGQRVVAVSARNTPEEFQVFYTIDYSVVFNGAEVAPAEHMELATNYSYNSLAVLAKEREQIRIQQALARDLADIVLRQVAAAPLKSH